VGAGVDGDIIARVGRRQGQDAPDPARGAGDKSAAQSARPNSITLSATMAMMKTRIMRIADMAKTFGGADAIVGL
jgi:hypothetical protein